METFWKIFWPCLAVVVAAVIGACAAVLVSWLNHLFTARREKQQRRRDVYARLCGLSLRLLLAYQYPIQSLMMSRQYLARAAKPDAGEGDGDSQRADNYRDQYHRYLVAAYDVKTELVVTLADILTTFDVTEDTLQLISEIVQVAEVPQYEPGPPAPEGLSWSDGTARKAVVALALHTIQADICPRLRDLRDTVGRQLGKRGQAPVFPRTADLAEPARITLQSALDFREKTKTARADAPDESQSQPADNAPD